MKSIVAPSRTTSVQWIAPVAIPHIKRPTIRFAKPAVLRVAKLPKLIAPPPDPEPTVLKAPPQPIPVILAQQPPEPAVQKEVVAVAPAAKGN